MYWKGRGLRPSDTSQAPLRTMRGQAYQLVQIELFAWYHDAICNLFEQRRMLHASHITINIPGSDSSNSLCSIILQTRALLLKAKPVYSKSWCNERKERYIHTQRYSIQTANEDRPAITWAFNSSLQKLFVTAFQYLSHLQCTWDERNV